MLQERVEELKQKKQMGVASDSCAVQHFEAPIVEIRELEYSTIEILILCAQNKRFVLYEAIKIVEEEGAKVINATSTTVGGNVICTVHSQVSSSPSSTCSSSTSLVGIVCKFGKDSYEAVFA